MDAFFIETGKWLFTTGAGIVVTATTLSALAWKVSRIFWHAPGAVKEKVDQTLNAAAQKWPNEE